MAGEPVKAVVTVTNHAGQTLTFYGDGRSEWLTFILKDRNGNPVSARRGKSFGKMVIKPGETLAREVILSEHFILSEQGNFSATAVVNTPGRTGTGASSNRVTFSQAPGVLHWSQKVGINGKPGVIREYRLYKFSGDDNSQLYAQVRDDRTGNSVRTFMLGPLLSMRKPLVTLDKSQRMHVMFLATPTMWVHYQIDTDGRVVSRDIHERLSHGDPGLATLADGTVRVTNSSLYDPKAAAEAKAKVRKASDRPPVNY